MTRERTARGQVKHDGRPEQAAKQMCWIPGGTFRMGSVDFYPGERPVHRVTVDGFWVDRHAVTNRQFQCFVRYRPAAREAVDTSACHIGFRCVLRRPAHPAEEGSQRMLDLLRIGG